MSTGPVMSTAGLAVTNLSVTYGGHHAVEGLSLTAPPGRVTGLIGPNGAGKTSSFNAITGLLRPSGGGVALDGVDLLPLSPAARARHGLGRTFQRMELLEELTVAENIAIAREASLAGGTPWRHLVGRRHDRATIHRDVEESLAVCSVTELAGRQVASLSTGQRRLVELARVAAGGFRILLLDEPSSGLDVNETQRFGTILEALVAQRGVGILLVEHDMSLVMRISSYIHVIDFGRPIFEGSPGAVMASDIVRAAYLGSEAVEVA
jgi:ABC-type branched-subunit amino acid transport system ATPase component